MKKLFLIAFLIFLLLPLIYAVEFNIKENFAQGETMIAKVSGNFITPITKSNVFFYKEHVRIPMDYGVEKIDKEYYIYASLSGKAEGNYSISIENVQYMKGAETLSDNIVKNFSITNATADFSLKPGVIVSSGDFSLEIQNLKDKQIAVIVKTQIANISERDISIITQETTAKVVSVSLVSGEVGKIYFKSGSGLPTFQKIELKSENFTYEIPVYIFTSLTNQEAPYRLEPAELISSIPTNSIIKKIIFLYNTGDREIRNISLSLSDSIKPFVNLSQNYVESLASKTNIPIELSFLSPGETEVSGTLKANINSEMMLYSQISLKFLSNYTPVNDSSHSSNKTCEELQGKICSQGEACDKGIEYARDSVCCLGNCVSTSKKSPVGTIIAIAIFIVLIVVGIWFYKKKYKKAKKPVDLLKIANKKY